MANKRNNEKLDAEMLNTIVKACIRLDERDALLKIILNDLMKNKKVTYEQLFWHCVALLKK